jgi:cytochrome c556
MKRLMCVVAVLTLIAGVSALSGADKEKKESLMKKKLTHSQKILEGITLGDFKKVSVNAEKLLAISKAGEWKADTSAKYKVYSGEFRRLADKLIDKAKAKDLDGATLAYVEMTLNCVKCHKYVRDVQMARR